MVNPADSRARVTRTCILLTCLLVSGAARAQSGNPFNHRFSISAAGYWPEISTTVRANGAGGLIGTSVNLETDLGLDDRDTLFAGGLSWNIAHRHSLDLLYFELGRRGTKGISHEINFQGHTFALQTSIQSLFETNVLRLSYGYAFLADDRQRLLAQIGVHYTKVKARLETDLGPFQTEATSDVPLPVIGIAYERRLGEHFAFDVTGQLFRLEFDDLSGSLDNAALNFYWAPARRFSIYVGYNYYSINVDARKQHWNGSFDFAYQGPWAGVVLGFGSTK